MKTVTIPRLIALSVLFTAAACSNNKQETAPAAETSVAASQTDNQPTYGSGIKETNNNMTALLDPSTANEKAPDKFKVKFKTTRGNFSIEVTRAWAPLGADRFYNLVKAGFFTDLAFFRVISGFMVQFGINGDPAVSAKWKTAGIADDAPSQSNLKGYITYAMSGPNSRTTQLFINYADNSRLDSMGFTPFGKVTTGMEVVENIYSGYGDGPPSGMGPDQGRAQTEGNVYFRKAFPRLDYINSAALE